MYLTAIAVISLDGRLTRHDEPGAKFASRADQEHFRASMRAAGLVIMGRRTFDVERERILAASDGPRRIVITRSPEAFRTIARPGALEFRSAAPAALMNELAEEGVERGLLLGGGAIFRLFAEEGLVDEWQITVEPRLFGAGAPLVDGAMDAHLRFAETRLLGPDTLLLRYLRA